MSNGDTEATDVRLRCALLHGLGHGVAAHPAEPHIAALGDRAEQRAKEIERDRGKGYGFER